MPLASGRVFVFLDLIRGIAAIAVVLQHSGDFFPKLFAANYLAVDLFFILSGFVLAFAYQDRLKGDLTWREFSKLRFIRLYPVFLLGAVLGAVWLVSRELLTGGGVSNWAIAAISLSLVMMPSPHAKNLYPTNGPSWSLLFEILINLVYAVVAKWLSLRALVCIVLLSAVGLVAAAWYQQSTNIGFLWTHLYGGAARVSFGFFAGVLIFQAYNIGYRAPEVPAAFLVIALIAALAFSGLYINMVKILFLFPLIVWFGASIKISGHYFSKIASYCGLISYPIYMIHVPMMAFVANLLRHFDVTLDAGSRMFFGAFILIGVVLASHFVALHFDPPARKFLRGLLRGRAGTEV